MSEQRRPFGIKIELGDVLVEIMSVTLAILLALAIGRWQENAQKQQSLHESVTSVIAEMSANARRLASIHPRHVRLLAEFAKLDAASAGGRITLAQLSNAVARGAPKGLGLALPQSTAWQIAQSSPGIGLLPYDERAQLTGLYNLQQYYFDAEEKFSDSLLVTSVPPEGNFLLVFENAEARLGDIVALESELARSYAKSQAMLAPLAR